MRFMLTYKASTLGKKVEFVKPFYTSQEDYRGLPNGKRKGCRYYAVDGSVLDADVNAANNIMLRYNKHSVPCSALDGQATVNWPIVIGEHIADSNGKKIYFMFSSTLHRNMENRIRSVKYTLFREK